MKIRVTYAEAQAFKKRWVFINATELEELLATSPIQMKIIRTHFLRAGKVK